MISNSMREPRTPRASGTSCMQSTPVQLDEIMNLYASGRFAEMEARARTLLKGSANSAVLLELLGIALCGQQRFAEALPALRTAAAGQPNDAQFHENLALCQRQLGLYAAAATSLRKSLALKPNSVEALNALGSVLGSQRKLEEARTSFEQALAIDPHHVGARFNLGKAFAAEQRWQEAEHHLGLTVAQSPAVAAFPYELGLVRIAQGKWAAAEVALRQSLGIDAGNPAVHAHLAWVLIMQNRRSEVAAAADATIKAFGDVERNITAATVGIMEIVADAYNFSRRHRDAMNIYKAILGVSRNPSHALMAAQCARNICDWDFAAELESQVLVALRSGQPVGSEPFPLLSMPNATSADLLACATRYARPFQENAPAVVRGGRGARGDRIRVGYLSGDLTHHAVSYLAAGVFEAHDRNRFEIVAYDYSPRAPSEFRRRLEAAFDRLVSLHDLSDRDAAHRIAADDCDVVVDLKGWTASSRSAILASRPAAVQVQWLGFASTMGAPWIDYIIADPVLIRPGEECFYSEKVIRLPYTFLPSDDRRPIGTPRARTDYGLPESGFVFCCFNQAFKISRDVFDAWMRLLRAVDGAVLWLPMPSEPAADAMRRRAVARHVDSERIIFAPLVAHNQDHLARIGVADLALDCFPYGSHTTVSDTLWAGRPLIAVAGRTFASRVAASVLTAAGLQDLVAASLDEATDLAIRLARDRSAMAELSVKVAACRQSPAFGTVRFTRELEAAFIALVDRQRAGLATDSITVARY
jgi:protein O-GlcNAc transferase